MCDNLYGLKKYTTNEKCKNESTIFWKCMDKNHGFRFCVSYYFKLKKCIENNK